MSALTKAIQELTRGKVSELTEADRSALLQASYELTSTLENAGEKILRLIFGIYDPISLRVAVDLDLADHALAHDGPIDLEELARKTKADRYLIQRVMRLLVSNKFFTEQGPGEYSTTPLTAALATGSHLKSAVLHITHLYHADACIPDFLAASEYANPSDAFDTPGERAFDWGKDSTLFDFYRRPGNERLADAFNKTMEMQRGSRDGTFMSEYPALQRLAHSDPDRVLFVDVGGSLGQQVKKFAKIYPSLLGKLVLEDLPEVIEKAMDVPENIIKIGHDFFKPQPDAVKNAKAFYLRTILHDWPEKQARQILMNIIKVMAEDSVVLIQEAILPETGVHEFEAKMDWHMMNLGAMERTEKQWTELAESVGLSVNGIWWAEKSAEDFGRNGIIELGMRDRLLR